MDNRETQCSGPAVVLAFLGGAMAGVVAGLLLAPKPGEETRRALKGYGRKAEEEVLEKAKEALSIGLSSGGSISWQRKRRMSRRGSRPDERL
jgi:gas vesicle protein